MTMLEPITAASINRMLRSNSWALQRLKPHAGKTARITCPPLQIAVIVTESGEVAAAAREAAADVDIGVTPGLMLRVLARDESAWTEATVSGDTGLAADIHYLWRHLRWDVEEDLSRVIGDIPAHRLAQTGRMFARWAGQSADNVARSFAEYWTEERPLITDRYSIEQFNREVDLLRDDVARLEKRLEFLADRQTAGGG
ncbi:MAG: hypothetical protein KIT18_17305 [Burkholderiales bacterium]|nr:hypothetical protein [Burkholderiales bacterium]